MTSEENRILRGFRINPTETPPMRERTAFVDVPDTPEGLQQATGSDTVDVVVRYLEGVPFNIVIDDEGLLRNRKPSAANGDLRVLLVGTLLVLGVREDGEFRSLTSEEREIVQRHTRAVRTIEGNVQWMLMGLREPWEMTRIEGMYDGGEE